MAYESNRTAWEERVCHFGSVAANLEKSTQIVILTGQSFIQLEFGRVFLGDLKLF